LGRQLLQGTAPRSFLPHRVAHAREAHRPARPSRAGLPASAARAAPGYQAYVGCPSNTGGCDTPTVLTLAKRWPRRRASGQYSGGQGRHPPRGGLWVEPFLPPFHSRGSLHAPHFFGRQGVRMALGRSWPHLQANQRRDAVAHSAGTAPRRSSVVATRTRIAWMFGAR
jgi:hypothetical protein